MPSMGIKTGDTVIVISGVDKGKRGRVIKAMPREGKVVVEGVNLRWKHQRFQRTRTLQVQSGRIQIPMPIPRSKVMLVCPHCDRPTRIRKVFTADGRKVRACKKCSELIDE